MARAAASVGQRSVAGHSLASVSEYGAAASGTMAQPGMGDHSTMHDDDDELLHVAALQGGDDGSPAIDLVGVGGHSSQPPASRSSQPRPGGRPDAGGSSHGDPIQLAMDGGESVMSGLTRREDFASGLPPGAFLQDEGSITMDPVPASATRRMLPMLGQADTYVQAVAFGVPYNGSSRLSGPPSVPPSEAGTAASAGDVQELRPAGGNDRRASGIGAPMDARSAGGLTDDSLPGREAADPSVAGSVISSIGRPPVKRSRVGAMADHRSVRGPGSTNHRASDRAGASASSGSAATGQPSQGVHPSSGCYDSGIISTKECIRLLTPLLSQEDLELSKRRVMFLSELEGWRQNFTARLREPGSSLGEELTRQIMAWSRG